MNELKKLKQEIEYLKEENKYYKELLISNKITFNPFVYTEKNEQLSTEEKTKEDKKSYSVIIRGLVNQKLTIIFVVC